MRIVQIFLWIHLIFVFPSSGARCYEELLHRASQYRDNPARVLAQSIKPTLIKVNRRRIEALARKAVALELDFQVPPWNWPPYLEKSDDFEAVFEFFLALNSINYKYFETGSSREFSHQGVHEALLTATRISQNWEALRAQQYRKLRESTEDFLRDELFKAEVPMPMLYQRVLAFRELGGFLRDFHSDGHSWQVLLKQIGNPAAFAYALPTVLPTWQDPFFKRPQLQMFMSIGRAESMGLKLFRPETLGELTVAADYMLPRILYALGAIDYLDPETLRIIKARGLIEKGSQLELELRAATVVATELWVKAMRDQGYLSATAPGLDAFLWTVATGNFRDAAKLAAIRKEMFRREMPPFHHTETTDY